MKTTFYALTFLGALCLHAYKTSGQDEIFIYGKVHTLDGNNYEGAIRWGNEEVYWTDFFNASKEGNENLRHLTGKELDALHEQQYSRWFSWEDRLPNWFNWQKWGHSTDNRYIHQFGCQFGEISMLRPEGRKHVAIELQSGLKYVLHGEGYNDVGAEIRVADKEFGEVSVRWSRIERIEFKNTPRNLSAKFGSPLYGTVETFGKKITGFIQWDRDERLTTDKLDGHSPDGKMSIEFGKIKSIERRGNRSLVVLKSGREIMLDGTNDVSSGHRGVIVMSREFPSIAIPWREFDRIIFDDKLSGSLPAYQEFKEQKELQGVVTTQDGKSIHGRIVYDLDETYEYEFLQGRQDDIEYTLPFRQVKSIYRKSRHHCTVELRNGKTITLEDAQDVDERNHGMLVFPDGKSNPSYVLWNDVKEITFQ